MRRAALGMLSSIGCMHSYATAVTQPNPLAHPSDVLPISARLHIDLGDMELPHFVLRNSAYFVIVSRDRLRFHVTLVHKWEEMVDPANWRVTLEDDAGHVYSPSAEDRPSDVAFKTRMWEEQTRSVVRDKFGDVVKVGDEVEKRPLASADVFEGQGDYVFHATDLMRADVKRLTLTMKRGDTVYRFIWNFDDGDAASEVVSSR
jgi:hypothetical protein